MLRCRYPFFYNRANLQSKGGWGGGGGGGCGDGNYRLLHTSIVYSVLFHTNVNIIGYILLRGVGGGGGGGAGGWGGLGGRGRGGGGGGGGGGVGEGSFALNAPPGSAPEQTPHPPGYAPRVTNLSWCRQSAPLR